MSKPRLKAINKRKSNDNYMHCCNWCHYYQQGTCFNKDLKIESSYNVYEVAESGRLDEAIGEALNNDKLTRYLHGAIDSVLREWKISNKRRSEFKQWFLEMIEQHNLLVQEEVSEAVSKIYQNDYENKSENFEGIDIENPEDFCCKYWC